MSRSTANCHAVAPGDFAALAMIVAAWPVLPEHIRHAVLTLVRSVNPAVLSTLE
ncbi:MAG: hypothetical protein AABZ47_00480 [Planctomycetota bacterium]